MTKEGSRRHPQREELVAYLQDCIAERRRPASYTTLGRRFGMNRMTVYEIVTAAELRADLTTLRSASRELFSPSEDTAWFLGILAGTGGKIDPTRGELTFTTRGDDLSVMTAFRERGGKLLGKAGDPIKVRTEILPSESQSVIFSGAVVPLRELGDFRKAHIADTLEQKYDWLFEPEYAKEFISGLLDSGGHIDADPVSVKFFTSQRRLAEKFQDLLLIIGISGSRVFNITSKGHSRYHLEIKKIDQLRLFAEKVQSVNPQRQQQLEEMKSLEKRERKFSYPSSAEALFVSWEELRTEFGEITTTLLNRLRAAGRQIPPHSQFTKYFGFDEKTGKYSFPKATERLQELETLEPAEREHVLQSIEINTVQRKYPNDFLLNEWRRLRPLLGDQASVGKWNKLYKNGTTEVEYKHFLRIFGKQEDGKLSWFLARTTLDNLIDEN